LALFALAYLINPLDAHPSRAQSTNVFIFNYGFFPSTMTVPAGTTVTWVHQGGSTPHTTTSDAGSAEAWDSGVLQNGASFSHTFNAPGTFHYHCSFHAIMTATIIVQAATSSTVDVPLSKGWNLLSNPVHTASLNTTADLAANIDISLGANSIAAIATYASGRFDLYVPSYSAPQPVTSDQGIFVLSQVGGTWHPAGDAFAAGQPVALQPGWNLVAAPFPSQGLMTDSIANEIGTPGTVEQIATYSGGAYHPWSPGDTPTLVPATSGMWILCACSPNTNWQPM
jgi:plastocyanin